MPVSFNRRMSLQLKLEEVLGSRNVYFQPPENVKLQYPAIVYHRDRSWDIWADDGKYLLYRGYILTHIGYDPDSTVLDRLELLPMCSFERHYESDGLNHDVYLIYN